MKKLVTTTPDPEFNIPESGEPNKPTAQEAAEPVQIPPAPPGSDGLQGAKPGTIYSPGEGITEEEAERAARDTGG